MPVSMEISLHYRFDTLDPEAMEELSLKEDRRQQKLKDRARQP